MYYKNKITGREISERECRQKYYKGKSSALLAGFLYLTTITSFNFSLL
jgi:hypothetical protein